MFGVQRARSTVHNWVHKAGLQPEDGRSPNHVADDETVIRLNDERYWLYAAVDPDTNDLLHTKLEPTRTNVLAYGFFVELRESHDVSDAVFLVDGATPLQEACRRHGLDSRYKKHGNRNSVERVFRDIKRRTRHCLVERLLGGSSSVERLIRPITVVMVSEPSQPAPRAGWTPPSRTSENAGFASRQSGTTFRCDFSSNSSGDRSTPAEPKQSDTRRRQREIRYLRRRVSQ